MSRFTMLAYIAATQVIGLLANVFDPDANSVWMIGGFLVLAIGFFGEMAILGLPRSSRPT